jgi:hypothetical protein
MIIDKQILNNWRSMAYIRGVKKDVNEKTSVSYNTICIVLRDGVCREDTFEKLNNYFKNK